MDEPVYASASVRNSAPILDVLRYEFRNTKSVLEIGSGTGYHAVTFAASLSHLQWQTSDRVENHDHINRAIEKSAATNLGHPIALDVSTATLDSGQYDAIYTCNTAHIMSFSSVGKMIELVGKALPRGGIFCAYGPFKRNGVCSTPSNTGFDQSLRSRNSDMGIRDLEALDDLLKVADLRRRRIYSMPANNLLVIWRKRSQ